MKGIKCRIIGAIAVFLPVAALLVSAPHAVLGQTHFGAEKSLANPNGGGQGPQTQSDMVLFRNYLSKNHPNKQWKAGPTLLDSAELRQAYPGRRFYFVSSPQLLHGIIRPPGPKKPSNGEELPKDYLSLTVRIGPEKQVTPLRTVGDLNQGLMKILKDEDASIAAAAILTTQEMRYFGPSVVAAKRLRVERTDVGWACLLKTQSQDGRVNFSADGKCTLVSLRYCGPFPP